MLSKKFQLEITEQQVFSFHFSLIYENILSINVFCQILSEAQFFKAVCYILLSLPEPDVKTRDSFKLIRCHLFQSVHLSVLGLIKELMATAFQWLDKIGELAQSICTLLQVKI